MRIDEFYDKQPEPRFVDILCSPMHSEPPAGFGKGEPREGEIRAEGMYILNGISDPEGLLDTAIEDLGAFISVCGIGGDTYPRSLSSGPCAGAESFTLTVTESGASVLAEDIEGARRAIYYLEEQLIAREGAILPLGSVTKKQVITRRITRGYFSPTNRAPKWGDELFDGVDYYSDEYLSRLAHNGTNGLWIYTSFAQLVRSPYFPELDGEKCERRMEKLTSVVEKCRRYGIGVYVFAIEPMGLFPEEAKPHPELFGAPAVRPDERRAICLRAEAGREHVIYCLSEIFRRIPHLAGYIDITAGERPTNCASIATFGKCPRCGAYSRGENLAYAIDVIKEGLRRAGTGAEFISWTYGHRYWSDGDILDYVDNAPTDAVLMQNFEDKGYDTQLGRTRVAWDYWLSYVGPSPIFEITAERAKRLGKKMYAKMQVCSSHEIATVPYIPTPGILYDKYKAARELGVTGIMECWYFGNYPSIMNRASTALSYDERLPEKSEFILELAALTYGRSNAEAVAQALSAFENAYRSYPTNIMFSYYGPMHDGVVWELFPIPKNRALPRSWLLLDPPDGDRIGECLFSGHTLDEALILTEKMRDEWRRGLSLLPFGEERELVTCAKAIGILFESGYNILSFYKLRSELGKERGDLWATVTGMEAIVAVEIENSLEMARLCEIDPRLGYHSEAEGFKFFPKKLRARAEKLKALFDTDFREIRSRLLDGKAPLGCYYAEGEDSYALVGDKNAVAWVSLNEKRAFRAYMTEEGIALDIKCSERDDFSVCYELELFSPEPEVVYQNDEQSVIHTEIALGAAPFKSGLALGRNVLSHQGVFGDMIDEILSDYTLETQDLDGGTIHTLRTRIPEEKWDRRHAIRLDLRVGDSRLKRSDDPVQTLGKATTSPDEFVYLCPKR